MKKPLKITLISFGSLFAIILAVIVVAVSYIFSPKRLTPIVGDLLAKNLTCQTELDKVELTFFSTFPNFEVQINNLVLKQPMNGSKSDTLLAVGSLGGRVAPFKYLFDKELIISGLTLNNGFINLYTDNTGRSNYDIFPTDTTEKDTTAFSLPFDFLELQTLDIKRLRIDYTDDKSGISTAINNIDLSLGATLYQLNGNASLDASAKGISFLMNDSTAINVSMKSLKFKAKGNKKDQMLTADLFADASAINLAYGTDQYVKNRDVSLQTPISFDLQKFLINLQKGSVIDFAKNKINLNGWLTMPNEAIDMNIDFRTDMLTIANIMELLPDNIRKSFADITINGKFDITGGLKGRLHGDTIPDLVAHIGISNTSYSQKGLPFVFHHIKGDAELTMGTKSTDLTLKNIGLKFGKSSATVGGSINDLTGRQMCRLNINGNLNFDDIKAYMPDSTMLTGNGKANIKCAFTLDDIAEMNMKKLNITGTLAAENLNMTYKDSTRLALPKANVAITIPSKDSNAKFAELIEVDITNASPLDFEQVGTMKAKLHSPNINLAISDITDDSQPLAVRCSYDMESADITMDTIMARITQPKGDFYMLPSEHNKDFSKFIISIASPKIYAENGKDLHLSSSTINLNGSFTYGDTNENLFLQYMPYFDAKANDLVINTNIMQESISIPVVDFKLTPENLTINRSRMVIKNNDFNLSGVVTNITEYLNNNGLLKAEMDFTSDMVDIYELMDLVSGFGAKDEAQKAALAEKPLDGDQDPFMVPWNVDVVLNTRVSHGKVSTTDIYDLGGTLIIRDGIMVLEQMGFTCEATKMQLTSIYRSERKNHLFLSLDFHLLDIEIDKLINMVPQIDTIVPMLKYFSGKGEFHLAAETYLKSNYDIKYSTIRGASAFEGKDLVLLDNETFNSMAKILRFKKKTQNVIDSLSVELTIFRDEVELFPFLLSMDNYQVVMQGKYNLSQNYKIKAETISPIRLGVDLTSTKAGGAKLEKLRLINLQYSNLFRPEKHNATQRQIMEMKKTISESLKANVKK